MKAKLSLLAALLLVAVVPRAKAQDASAPLVPTTVTCEHFESVSNDQEMTSILTGRVVVTGTNIRITCDRMEIISYRQGAKEQVVARENQFKSLVATGHVKIVQGEREATCGRADVLPGDDKIILTETPMVEDKQHGVTWTGSSLELYRGQRRVVGKDVVFHGPPVKDLGFDKNDKSPLAPDTKAKQ